MFDTKQTDRLTQTTLKESIRYVGVGLHTGRGVSMHVRSSEINTGICFVRKDAPVGQGTIPALWHNVTDTQHCTVIRNQYGVSVRSIEHLMAALRGCNIDNAIIELDGPEVPIMDGSSRPFVSLIERARKVHQAAHRKMIRIDKPISVWGGDKFAILTPHNTSRLTVDIAFSNPVVSYQYLSVKLTDNTFKHDLAGARTFSFMNEVGDLRKRGLARGGSLHNAIVIDEDCVINEEGLRFEDEFIRHKILDCIGDLYLAGAPILGHFHAYKPGHKLNNALVHELLRDETACSYVSSDENKPAAMWRKLSDTTVANAISAIRVAREWMQKVA